MESATDPSPSEQAALTSAAAFAEGQAAALAPPLVWLMRIGLAMFSLSVWLRYFRGFCSLPLPTRRRVVAWWAFGPFSLTRKLFKPLRTTALLAYYEYAEPGAGERAAS